MAGELRALGERLESAAVGDQALARLRHAVGQASKRSALDVVEVDAGADRRLSGMRRRVRIGVGYDPDPLVLNLRPKGLVVLLDRGRKRTTRIVPRRRRGRGGRPAALRFGGRFVRSSRSTPSRGHRTIDRTVRAVRVVAPRAAAEQLVVNLRKGMQ